VKAVLSHSRVKTEYTHPGRAHSMTDRPLLLIQDPTYLMTFSYLV